MLGQNYSRAESGPVGTVAAFANSVESIAGCDHPRIGRWAPQLFTEIFEHGGVFRRQRGKIVKGLIRSGRQTRGSNVVAKNAVVHYLRKEAGLRNQFPHHVW